MKALFYTAAGQGTITEVPKPICDSKQVIIQVKAASICKGVEVGHSQKGTGMSEYPVIPGHEFAGVITEVGSDVKDVKVGDRVTADNTELCGECYYCKQDQPLYCEHFGSLGHNINGGFAEYVVVNKDKVFLIPETVPFDSACLTEPVACCIHAMDMLDVKFGEVVVVVGGGPNGQILCQLLSRSNAQKVILLDRHTEKLKIAEKCGTVGVLVTSDGKHFEKILEMYPQGVDAVVDATGNSESISQDFQLLKKGGRVLQYGVTHEGDKVEIDCFTFFLKELKYYSTMAQTHCFGRALDYINNGTVIVDELITYKCRLDDYFGALDKQINDRSQLKIVIHP